MRVTVFLTCLLLGFTLGTAWRAALAAGRAAADPAIVVCPDPGMPFVPEPGPDAFGCSRWPLAADAEFEGRLELLARPSAELINHQGFPRCGLYMQTLAPSADRLRKALRNRPDRLELALTHPDARVRAGTAHVLERPWEPRPDALPALRRLLDDPEPEARTCAALALAAAGDPAAAPALVALLEAPDAFLQDEAARALGDLGEAAALPALQALAERADGYEGWERGLVLEAAEGAIRQLGGAPTGG